MQDVNIYSVMTIEDTSVNQENNSSEFSESREPHFKFEFPLFSKGPRQEVEQGSLNQLGTELSDNSIPETKYYRLDQVVFAEPIAVRTNTEELCDSDTQEDVGEITFVDNVMMKKREGKRNKYFIDIKDGCLDCPVSNCFQTFATKTLLKAHVRKVHCATTKYMCEECGAGFTAAYLLKRHSAVHSGSKVQCAVCGKWLSQRTDLSVHIRTHGAARRHACATCGRRFLRLSSLRRHETFVHRDGLLVCQVCHTSFASRKLWSRHRATHAAQPCGVCGAAVPRSAAHRH